MPRTFLRGAIRAETGEIERSSHDVQKEEHSRQKQEQEQRPWNGTSVTCLGNFKKAGFGRPLVGAEGR